jgi:DNA-binding MurR/RpiR family transcriptional regulator
MTIRKDPLEGLDPAVNSVLTDAARRQRIRQLPRDEQARARRDAARKRIIYEVPEVIQDAIAEIAQQEGMSPSSVVSLLLAEGIRLYRAKRVSFYGLKRASRSPRYEWVLREDAAENVLANGLTSETEETERGKALWT